MSFQTFKVAINDENSKTHQLVQNLKSPQRLLNKRYQIYTIFISLWKPSSSSIYRYLKDFDEVIQPKS